MKKHMRKSDGKYHINGKTYEMLVGSRAQVHHGTAYKTSSSAVKPRGDALTKKDIKMNKNGRLVSAVKSLRAKKEKRLEKYGYFTQKGKFGAVKKTEKNKHHSRRKGKKSGTKRRGRK